MKLTINWPGMVAHIIALLVCGLLLTQTSAIHDHFLRTALGVYLVIVLIALGFPMFKQP